MPDIRRQLHLVIDDAAERADVLRTVRIPEGASYLRPGRPVDQLVAAEGSPGEPRIEPLLDSPQPRLLVLCPSGGAVPRINGRRGPRVCLLRVGDQLQLADGLLLHLTVENVPRIEPPGEDQIGTRCGLCRTAITAEHRRVYTCNICETVLHHDEPGADDALECAALRGECAGCAQPVDLEGGFGYVPDLG